jgi:hypothetical protein
MAMAITGCRQGGRGAAQLFAVAVLLGAGCGSRGSGAPDGSAGSPGTGGTPANNGGAGGATTGAGGQDVGTGGVTAGGTGGATLGTGGSSPGTGGATSGSGGGGEQPDGSTDSDGSADHVTCSTPTSISGVVYDPAGIRPVYNAFVYAPTKPLDPIAPGVSCDRCATTLSGAPAAMARTDATGHFKLEGLPAGTNVPVVIQIGKWRREIMIPSVVECADTPITDADLTRLPRNQSEGHLPKIAVTTGGADALECFIHKLGLSDSEFTTDTGDGRVNLFVGGEPVTGGGGQGATSFAPTFGSVGSGLLFPFAATSLWNSPTKLAAYDMMMMSCEGSQYPDAKLPNIGNVKAFADAGGRIIASHLQYYWLRNGPEPWPSTATYLLPQSSVPDPSSAIVSTTFPGGAALADWLVAVGATPTRGSLPLFGTEATVAAVTPPTLAWLTKSVPAPATTTLLTFDTPVELAATAQCGRVGFVDLHVKNTVSTQNGKDTSSPTMPFPTGCKSTILTPQEQALEFMLFDVGACIQ